MPEKKTAKRTTAKRTMAKRTTAKRASPRATAQPTSAPRPAAPEVTSASGESCPRCGSPTFGPEQRTRVEGNRTVRYTILVCERGHTFARAVPKPT